MKNLESIFEESALGEIAYAVKEKSVIWYFSGEQLCISFEVGAFGYTHAEGSLSVTLSV